MAVAASGPILEAMERIPDMGDHDIAPALAPRRRTALRIGTAALAVVAGGAGVAFAAPDNSRSAASPSGEVSPIALLTAQAGGAGPRSSRAQTAPAEEGSSDAGGRERRARGDHAGVGGTVASVSAPDFTVTRPDGSTTKVVTDADTVYMETVKAAVADATVGSHVVARGTRTADGSLAASAIDILPPKPASAKGGEADDRRPAGRVGGNHVHGTVASNDGSKLTVTAGSTTVTVTTTSATEVNKTAAAAFSAITQGDQVRAMGAVVADGAITADRVHLGGRRAGRGPGGPRGGHDGSKTGGSVASVDAPSFTVTKPDGTTSNVTTTSATEFMKTSAATVADATVGSHVGVHGTRASDGSVAAKAIHIRPAREATGAGDNQPGPRDGGHVHGAVASNDGSTLTVTTASGTVTVTTTSATKVAETSAASFSDITVGAKVMAGGTASADGTITAQRVHIGERIGPAPRGPGRPGGRGPGGDGRGPGGGPGGGQRQPGQQSQSGQPA